MKLRLFLSDMGKLLLVLALIYVLWCVACAIADVIVAPYLH
jgi:hypothetical protein